MKKFLLLFVFIYCFSQAQEKEIMIGALSKMTINFDYKNENYYNSELGRNTTELNTAWKKYKVENSNGELNVRDDKTIIYYEFLNNEVKTKKIAFFDFASYFFFIQKFILFHPELKVESRENMNIYNFTENGSTRTLETSFFLYQNPKDIYDFDTIFYVDFR